MTETTTVTVEGNGVSTDIEVPTYDAKAIEQEMLQAAQNRAIDPAESAAMVFHMYKPEVLKRIPKLSSNALRRVLQLLVEYPLNDKKLAGTSQIEKEVFLLADAMLQSKFVMMQQTYMESAEELVKAQDELVFGKEAETVLTEQQEFQNKQDDEYLAREAAEIKTME